MGGVIYLTDCDLVNSFFCGVDPKNITHLNVPSRRKPLYYLFKFMWNYLQLATIHDNVSATYITAMLYFILDNLFRKIYQLSLRTGLSLHTRLFSFSFTMPNIVCMFVFLLLLNLNALQYFLSVLEIHRTN